MELVKHLDSCFDPLASFVESFAPSDATPKQWFLSPKQHIYQVIIANVVFGLSWAVGMRLRASRQKEKKEQKLTYKPLSTIDHLYRIVLTCCIILQLVYKTIRGWRILGYMLQPCHMATLCYLYCLYTKNPQRGAAAFRISIHYLFFTVLALLVPDLTQLHLPFEVTNFYVQHIFLLLAPIHFLVSKRFPSDNITMADTLIAIGVGGLFHFNVQLPAAILTGVNINYMLWPPPGLPPFVANKYFLLILSQFFVVLAWFSGCVVPRVIGKLSSSSSTPAQGRRKTKHA